MNKRLLGTILGMVLQPVPAHTIKSLRTAYRRTPNPNNEWVPPQFKKFFAKLPSADHRRTTTEDHKLDITYWGYRVRKLPLKSDIIIKRCHDAEPRIIIRTLRRLVGAHNTLFPNAQYVLRKPIAYHIGGQFIAMSNANIPSVEEILGGTRGWDTTQRGATFMEEIAKKVGRPNWAIASELETAHRALCENIYTTRGELVRKGLNFGSTFYNFTRANTLVPGYEKGKFIFVPLIDTQ